MHQNVSTNPDEIVVEASVVVAAPTVAVHETAWLLLFDVNRDPSTPATTASAARSTMQANHNTFRLTRSRVLEERGGGGSPPTFAVASSGSSGMTPGSEI